MNGNAHNLQPGNTQERAGEARDEYHELLSQIAGGDMARQSLQVIDREQQVADVREKLGVAPELERFYLAGSTEHVQQEEESLNDRTTGPESRARVAQERMFGTVEIQTLVDDTTERLALPAAARRGHELIDETTGEAKRPIMDISLDARGERVVTQEIARRASDLDATLVALQRIAEGGDAAWPDGSSMQELLFESGAWHRSRGLEFGLDSPGGTLADLYIDATDLAKYKQIDQLAEQITGKPQDSEARLALGIVSLAGTTFPSGVEMMHATTSNAIGQIAQRGALATRSEVAHGAARSTKLNGGFIHMSRPATAAYEYSDLRHVGYTLIGIPIDTVIENSPFLQLEDAYAENSFSVNGVAHSMQYEMSGVQLNDVEAAPLAFRSALETMEANINGGVRKARIDQGRLNNYGFATSGDAESAGRYSYPLNELSVYVDNPDIITNATNAYPDAAESLYAVTTAIVGTQPRTSETTALNRLPLPMPRASAGGGIKLFMPISERQVAFTEASAGNDATKSGRAYSLESVTPGTEAKFSSELIRSGVDATSIMESALASINERSGDYTDLYAAYVRDRSAFEDAGFSPRELVSRLSAESLRGTRIDRLNADINQRINEHTRAGESAADIDREQESQLFADLVREHGDRLYAEAPEKFYDTIGSFEELHYQPTDQQRHEAMQWRQEEDRKLESMTLPDLGAF